MTAEEQRLRRVLATAWDNARSSARSINQGIDLRPSAFEDVFAFTAGDADKIELEMKPVVFSVPERADRLTQHIFIAVEGRLAFDRAALKDRDEALAVGFGTHVGYFRQKHTTLTHIYGAHYDFDEYQTAHPVFHHQMGDMSHLKDEVIGRYSLTIADYENRVQPILRQVRTPTAQVDVFSIFAQICADHLLYKGSGTAARTAFQKVLKHCNAYKGIGHRMDRLNVPPASTCYRSLHWYPEGIG